METRRPKFIRREITRHGNQIWSFRRGREYRRLPDEYGSDEFWDAYSKAFRGEPPTHVREAASSKREAEIEAAVIAAWKRAKNRAQKKGWEFTLTVDGVLHLSRENGYKCALSGVPFLLEPREASHKRPFVPSLDRIDCKKGYTPDNVRLVIFAINLMMAEWGEEVMCLVMNAYRYTRNKTSREKARTF